MVTEPWTAQVRAHGGSRQWWAPGLELWANRSADLPGSASHLSYRQSCDGSVGPTRLDCSSLPRLGATFQLEASGLAPNAVGYFGIGLQDASWGAHALPLDLAPFGAPGCFVNVDPLSILLRSSDATGVAGLALPVPNSYGLLGLPIYSQYGSLDRGPGRPAQFTTTNAGHGIVGL